MSEPAQPKRTRAPVAIPLAIMVVACLLIVTALVLIAQGAVARDARAARPAANDGMVSERSEAPISTIPSTHVTSSHLEGRFVLGGALTDEERALAARIAESSSGGGLAVGAEILVVVDAGSAP